jgi:hypothetical protein
MGKIGLAVGFCCAEGETRGKSPSPKSEHVEEVRQAKLSRAFGLGLGLLPPLQSNPGGRFKCQSVAV